MMTSKASGDRSFASQLAAFPQPLGSADKGVYMNLPQYNAQGNYTQQNDEFFSWNTPSKQPLNTNPVSVRDNSASDLRRMPSDSVPAIKPAPRQRIPKNRPPQPPSQPAQAAGTSFSGPQAQNAQSFTGGDFSVQYQPVRSTGTSQKSPSNTEDRQLDMDVEVSEYTIVNQVISIQMSTPSRLHYRCLMIQTREQFRINPNIRMENIREAAGTTKQFSTRAPIFKRRSADPFVRHLETSLTHQHVSLHCPAQSL